MQLEEAKEKVVITEHQLGKREKRNLLEFGRFGKIGAATQELCAP